MGGGGGVITSGLISVPFAAWFRDISVWACSQKRWYLQDFCGLESRLRFMSEGSIEVTKS